MNDTDQISELIRIYNRYPIAEVQVHARLGKDAYNGTRTRKLSADSMKRSGTLSATTETSAAWKTSENCMRTSRIFPLL